MKMIYKQNELSNSQKDLDNEIYILKLLSFNNNSVKYYGKYEKENEEVIVMEKCDKNLKEFIKERGTGLTVEEIKKHFLEMNKLFKYMQKEKIIHRDLKLDNFLVKFNKEKTDFIIKLSDYGICKIKNKTNSIFSGIKGTIGNVAPEIVLEKTKNYDNEVDIFSLGVILYQISHNLQSPFGENLSMLLTYQNFYEKDNFEVIFSENIKNDNLKIW